MNNSKFIDDIFHVFGEAGIKRVEDFESFDDTLYYHPNRYVFGGEIHEIRGDKPISREEALVSEVYSIILHYYDSTIDYLSETDKPYLVANDGDMETYKYMCFFPSSSIILSEPVYSEGNYENDGIRWYLPKRLLLALFEKKNLIKNDIIKILPAKMAYDDWRGNYRVKSLGGRYDFGRYDGPAIYDTIGENGIYLEKGKVEKIYFTFPWLYGAELSDYVIIAEKNTTLFRSYRSKITRLMQDIKKSKISDVSNVFYDIEQAHLNMQIEFEKTRNQLLKKGIATVVGLACTFIPLLIDIPIEMKTILSSLLGVTTIKELINIFLNEKSNLKNIGINDPLWLTWQWEKKQTIDKAKTKH